LLGGIVLYFETKGRCVHIFSTLDVCRKAWEEAGKYGDLSDRIERNKRWIQYYSYIARQQESVGADLNPHAEEVASYISDIGWLGKDATVLDIGAGTGTYSMSFAKRYRKVTAFDMDSASLAVLKYNAGQLRLSNIECVEGMWETYAPNKSFSMTFSSMCPAICTYEELLKMEAMTKDMCCLIAITRGSYDLHRKNLMQMLEVKPVGYMTTEAICYYEILYLMGRQPNVRNWTRHYEYNLTTEETCSRNEEYFKIFGISAEKSHPILWKYFNEKAIDGYAHEISHLNTALIYWKPQSEK